MIGNYLQVAIRNMGRNMRFTALHLAGLSLGLASVMLIAWYVYDELSYDKYSAEAKNIYRVERTFLNPQDKTVNLRLSAIAPPFAALLANDFREIKKVSQVLPNGPTPFKYDEKLFNENKV